MVEIENKCTECGGELEFISSSTGTDFTTDNFESLILNLYECKSCGRKCYII